MQFGFFLTVFSASSANPLRPLRSRILIALTLSAASAAQSASITSGPMVGATDMHTTTIWLQTDAPARAVLEYWPADQGKAKPARKALRTEAANDNAAQVRIDGLLQATRYAYRVRIDGKPAGPAQSFTTQTRWQWRDKVDPPDFTALMGSCSYVNQADRDRDGKPYGGSHAIFSKMAAQKPDLMLWLGDNTYLRENEYTSVEGMRYRYRADRSQADVQPLLRTGQHAAIWDDHDFGPDDSNSSFVFKDESLALFKRYWANGSYGLPETPGVFGAFSFSDVDFFLTDNRWYRDADRGQEGDAKSKTMFGDGQVRWLKNALLMSTAPFKVIVGGSQFLNDEARTEGWTHFKRERQDFLEWLQRNRVDGVIFLSGDRHFTELVKLEREGTYPLHDLTCSPLTAGPFARPSERNRAGQVAGTLVAERNFCSFAVTGTKQTRAVTLKAWDAEGRELWSQRLGLQDLQTPKSR